MNENYIVINGKKIELTEEQMKQLWIEPEKKRNNPFERANNEYYLIKDFGEVCKYTDNQDCFDNLVYDNDNYFNDESFAQQVALHQLLYRKLLKFAYDNEYEDAAEWDGKNPHWCIYYDNSRKKFDTTWQDLVQYSHVYFSTREGAERAIKEVVESFVKEYPDFVW
jgi:hypothetical protein